MARWTVLLVLALPALAFGQDGLKPEVLLMIDGSASMGEQLNGLPVVCQPRGASEPQIGVPYTPDTPLNMIKEALIGTVKSPAGARWCTADSPIDRDGHALGRDAEKPHVRQMCCINAGAAGCVQWSPCYNDHGRALGESDAVPHDAEAARNADGVLDVNIDAVKFGMMYTDGKLDPGAGANGHFSYGDENLAVPIIGQINVGARRPGDHIGGFIRPSFVRNINGGQLDGGEINDTDAEVRAHNEAVREVVGRLVPHGVSPISGLVHDAVQFYQGEGRVPCRHRSAILITRGRETQLVPGRPTGFPYEPAQDYIEQLNDLGIALHVVLIAPANDGEARFRAEQIADASEGGTFTRVSNSADLREKLIKLSRQGVAGVRSRTRPLIVSASTADYCGNGAFPCAAPEDATLQWRLNAFAWVAGGTAYGRIWASELTCAERDADRPSVPQARERRLRYEEVMRQRGEVARRAVSYDRNERQPFVVTGGAGAVFGTDGTNQLNDDARLAGYLGVQEAEVRDPAANAPPDDGVAADDLEADDVNDDNGPVIAGVPEDPDRIRSAGLLVNGHFGARGLGNDARRQLGATISGDLVALRPPALGLNDPSYIAYRTLEERRKTVIAAGGQDGLIHFFRAHDGVEVLSLLPGAGWGQLINGEAPMDGPLAVADIVPCRAIEGGDGDCPERLEFESWLVGTSGRTASNLFGVRLGALRSLMADADRPLDLDSDIGADGVWDKTSDELISEVLPELTLAGASSRPYLTHVRDGATVRAAIIVGCGEGDLAPNASSAGRCVLILDATTGDVIRRFDIGSDFELGGSMLYSMSGSPVAYPAGGIAPASRAYIGDAGGQIWRMDLRDVNPDNWSIAVAWPPRDADERGDYTLGRAVVDRPSLALREDGGLVVTFATDRSGAIDDPNLRAYVVSFTDRVEIGDDAVSYVVSRNWLLPLNQGEYATGAPIVRDSIVYVTTREGEANGEQCDAIRGRLYGVHYYQRYVNAEGEPASFRRNNGPPIEAKPALGQFDQDGPTGEKVLSLILPPGLVAYGMAVALTPSCDDDVAGTTNLVLNVADETAGQRPAAGNGEGAKVEVVDNNRVTERPLNGGLFVRNQGVEFDVCIDCTSDGQPAAAAAEAHGNVPPFPSQVVYWGSTFLN